VLLELYYYEQCPFCYRVLSKIKDLDLGPHIQFKNTLEDPSHSAFHQEKTGRTTVPCLYIDGEPMFESADIIKWLEKNCEAIKA